jgi:pilus assembly protein CpaE
MPDSGSFPAPTSSRDEFNDAASARYDRPSLIGFVTDARSEAALRDGLGEVTVEQLDLRRGGVRAAVTAMQKSATPKVLLVDVSGEDQPLSALSDLAHVVEPDVCVLVIGDTNNIDFYREITRGLGAADYLAKPLTRDIVARHFSAFLRGKTPAAQTALGGRAISITGVRGGVGATTLAVNLAWNFGVIMRRHTVLLDPDIQRGSAAFLLNVQPGPGLRAALEAPERLDSLLAERAAQPAADRLHVLAGEEAMAIYPNPAPGAAHVLLDALRSRYNFIVADAPYAPVPLYRDLLNLVDQRVLVMEPTLAAVRDTLRLLSLPGADEQSQRGIVVLNRLGIPGGLTRKQVEDALKMKVDIAIPDLPRQVGNAATLGEPALASSSAFRAGVNELSRQVAFVGLLDSAMSAAGPGAGGKRSWGLFRKKTA